MRLSLQLECAGVDVAVAVGRPRCTLEGNGEYMAKEWIEQLAHQTKGKDHNAAEQYNAEKHRKEVIAAKGPHFFTALLQIFQADMGEFLADLKGTPLDQPTMMSMMPGGDLQVHREAVPMNNATYIEEANGITFTQQKASNQWSPQQICAARTR